MTTPARIDWAVTDPIGLIVDLVAAIENSLTRQQIHTAVTAVAGGRAKSRRLAAALAGRPKILADGKSPAPRAAGDLLIALRQAGATAVSPPCCTKCGKHLRTFQRYGQDWYCAVCGKPLEECGLCGNTRPVATRDRAGQPRCRQCPDLDDRDPVTVICNLIAELDPHSDPATIAAAVRQIASRPTHQHKLARALEEQPALLTGQAHLAPLRAVPRLIELLHAAGVAGIVRPECPGCHRPVRIDKPLNGMRVCRTCIAHSRIEQCARCTARREPVTRDELGQPICANCFTTDPANREDCMHCGRRRPVGRRTTHGPLCPSCPALPVLTCFLCGTTTFCGFSRATGQPWCPACQRRHATCSACSQNAAIVSGTLQHPLCAGCTAPAPWAGCHTCSDPDYPYPGQCARCIVNQRLTELMGPSTGTLPPGLQILRRDIANAEHHITAMRWLTKPSVAPILAGLSTGRIPLTHEALDALPASQPLAHLRQTLVAVGALPERDELMVGLEGFINRILAAQPDAERRKLLHRYLIWHLIRRMRNRNNGKPTTRQQSQLVRRLARGAVAFLDWLTAHDLTLDTCQQADLDHWAIDESATYRAETGNLIRWARGSKLTALHIPAINWNGPAQLLDHQHRWDTARRLLHDTDLKPEDRLAGLLVLLYAQGATAIGRLTTENIHIGQTHVQLRLGRVPIQLPEPLATIARTVASKRKGHATIGAAEPSPWLFPGGQPGRPISSARLTQRLNDLGIKPGQARSTALFQLATEIPAAILARTLGIHTDVAVIWQRHASGDWTNYAAEVSRRQRRHSNSSNI